MEGKCLRKHTFCEMLGRTKMHVRMAYCIYKFTNWPTNYSGTGNIQGRVNTVDHDVRKD